MYLMRGILHGSFQFNQCNPQISMGVDTSQPCTNEHTLMICFLYPLLSLNIYINTLTYDS